MKRIVKPFLVLLVVLSVFSGAKISAQCLGNSAPINELGVRLVSVSNAANLGGRYIPERTMSLGFINGLHYKRYGNMGAFRASLGMTQFDFQENQNCPNCLRIDAKIQGIQAKVGYEWFWMLGVAEPYIGIDAAFSYNSYKADMFSLGSSNYVQFRDEREKRGFGLSPMFGLRFFLSYAVSISAETNLDMMLFSKRINVNQIMPEATNEPTSFKYVFESTWQPINWLSLNVLF